MSSLSNSMSACGSSLPGILKSPKAEFLWQEELWLCPSSTPHHAQPGSFLKVHQCFASYPATPGSFCGFRVSITPVPFRDTGLQRDALMPSQIAAERCRRILPPWGLPAHGAAQSRDSVACIPVLLLF